jgi:hypothetical protein
MLRDIPYNRLWDGDPKKRCFPAKLGRHNDSPWCKKNLVLLFMVAKEVLELKIESLSDWNGYWVCS